MNASRNRREFLADVGRGMLVASVGYGMARELCLAPAFAADTPETSNSARSNHSFVSCRDSC